MTAMRAALVVLAGGIAYAITLTVAPFLISLWRAVWYRPEHAGHLGEGDWIPRTPRADEWDTAPLASAPETEAALAGMWEWWQTHGGREGPA